MASSSGQERDASDENDTLTPNLAGDNNPEVMTPATTDANGDDTHVVAPEDIQLRVSVTSGTALDSLDDGPRDTNIQPDATPMGGAPTTQSRIRFITPETHPAAFALTPRDHADPHEVHAIEDEARRITDSEIIRVYEREYNQISMSADDRDVRPEEEGPDLRFLGKPASLLRVS